MRVQQKTEENVLITPSHKYRILNQFLFHIRFMKLAGACFIQEFLGIICLACLVLGDIICRLISKHNFKKK